MKKKHEIHNRIYAFVLRVLKTVGAISRSTENLVIIKQVVRSAASIGANAAEADAAESKKEFVHRFTIAKKEAQETYYWLSLLFDHNQVPASKTSALLDECQQITSVISKIVLNAKNK